MNTAITAGFAIIYFAVTVFLCRGLKLKTRDLCITSIAVALTLVLECIRVPLPTGASISLCSMVPLMLLALICDYRMAFLGGWVTGIMAMFFVPGWQPVHWGQLFVEHLVCFSCLGYTGIFGKNKKWRILCGILLASGLKICGHLLSGVLFFSQNAWDGWGAWGYSLAYNVSQNVPLSIICGGIVLSLPLLKLRKAAEGRI